MKFKAILGNIATLMQGMELDPRSCDRRKIACRVQCARLFLPPFQDSFTSP